MSKKIQLKEMTNSGIEVDGNYTSMVIAENVFPLNKGAEGQVLTAGGSGVIYWGNPPSGGVTGPGSSTDNAVVRFDGATGSVIQNSSATIDDLGKITAPSMTIAGLSYPVADGTLNQALVTDGAGTLSFAAAGVAGPASSTDNAITRYDGTTGKLLQNSLVTIDDLGKITAPSMLVAALSYPLADGTNGQVLTTNGSGTLTLQDPTSDSLVDNSDGTFTHTAVDGTVVTIDMGALGVNDLGNGLDITLNGSDQVEVAYDFTELTNVATPDPATDRLLLYDNDLATHGYVTPDQINTNIYANDGTLTASRTVTLGGNNLTFSGTEDFVLADGGSLRTSLYGQGNAEVSDLSVTASNYKPLYATDGTIFESRIHTASASAPTLDVNVGETFYDTTTDVLQMRTYDGVSDIWLPIGYTAPHFWFKATSQTSPNQGTVLASVSIAVTTATAGSNFSGAPLTLATPQESFGMTVASTAVQVNRSGLYKISCNMTASSPGGAPWIALAIKKVGVAAPLAVESLVAQSFDTVQVSVQALSNLVSGDQIEIRTASLGAAVTFNVSEYTFCATEVR